MSVIAISMSAYVQPLLTVVIAVFTDEAINQKKIYVRYLRKVGELFLMLVRIKNITWKNG